MEHKLLVEHTWLEVVVVRGGRQLVEEEEEEVVAVAVAVVVLRQHNILGQQLDIEQGIRKLELLVLELLVLGVI